MRKGTKILLTLGLTVFLLTGLAAGGWYWYENNVDRSGWDQVGGVYFYKDFYGEYISGWTKIGENRYYFSPQNNAMATYWQTIDGKRYYFSGDGTMDTGFWEIDGQRYYFSPDGVMQTGWLDYEGNRFYLDENGVMAASWQDIGGKRYYFQENGILLTGRVFLDGSHYYLLPDGSMYTGWDVVNERLVYYLEDGRRATEWQTIDDKLYYFGLDGLMETGWITLDGNRYYLHGDGSAATSPTVIDGETWYFGPTGIQVYLVNSNLPVPKSYKPDLVTFVDWNQVDRICYDALSRMLADCNAAGIAYTFNSAYRTVAQQKEILELRTEEHMDGGMSWQQAYAKARETVALPGTSEHHLGLAVDLLGDEAIAWLNEHCWEYGFIVRYQADKANITGIIDEPWHFRYVGVDVAMAMKESGQCLEEYLGVWQPEEAAPTEEPAEEPEPTE